MVDTEKLPPLLFGLVFSGLVIGGLYFVATNPRWGLIDAIMMFIGLLFGVGLMPAMATPFVPSPPRTGGVMQQFVKIYMTIASMILGASVFYLKGSGQYVRKRLHIEGDEAWFYADGEKEVWEGAKQRLITFGRRPLGLAWSDEHPMFQTITKQSDIQTDGGEPATRVDMDQLHRILRGTNQLRAIDAAVRDAKESVGGGRDGIGQRTLIIAMIGLWAVGFGLTVWAMS